MGPAQRQILINKDYIGNRKNNRLTDKIRYYDKSLIYLRDINILIRDISDRYLNQIIMIRKSLIRDKEEIVPHLYRS